MIEIICAIGSTILLVVAMALRPATFSCPYDMYLHQGVREWGGFSCARPPIGGDDGDEIPIDRPGVIHGRIYCTGGARAIVVNYRTVGCQR